MIPKLKEWLCPSGAQTLMPRNKAGFVPKPKQRSTIYPYLPWQREREIKFLTPHQAYPRYKNISKKSVIEPEDLFKTMRIAFTEQAWLQQCAWIYHAEGEIAWEGLVNYEGTKNQFRVLDTFICEQSASNVRFEVSASASGKGWLEYLQANQIPKEDWSKYTSMLYLHGHSHVWMGTTPTQSIDDVFVEERIQGGNVPVFLRVIGNKAGRLECSLFFWQEDLMIVDVPWYIESALHAEVFTACSRDVAKKVQIHEVSYFGDQGVF